ncbi:MAG: HEAT repeat domain-containing protein [Anaerolineae bacterium]|nr:HEAT repeat domain-containing protein [Anaerolineae bacterium]
MAFQFLSRGLVYVAFIAIVAIGWLLKHRQSANKHQAAETVSLDSAEAIRDALKSPGWQTRLSAVKELAHQHSPDNLNALVDLLSDADPSVRDVALDAILPYGESAVPGLVTVLEHGNLEAREAAAKALQHLHPGSAVLALITALAHDESAWVRVPAAQALGAIATDEAAEALIHALDDPHADVVKAVRAALTHIGTPDALQALENHAARQNAEPSSENNTDFLFLS